MWLKRMYIWTYNFCVISVWCFVFSSSELLRIRFKWQIFIVCMKFLVLLFNMFHIYILCPHQIKKVTQLEKNISHRIPSFIKTKSMAKKQLHITKASMSDMALLWRRTLPLRLLNNGWMGPSEDALVSMIRAAVLGPDVVDVLARGKGKRGGQWFSALIALTEEEWSKMIVTKLRFEC